MGVLLPKVSAKLPNTFHVFEGGKNKSRFVLYIGVPCVPKCALFRFRCYHYPEKLCVLDRGLNIRMEQSTSSWFRA